MLQGALIGIGKTAIKRAIKKVGISQSAKGLATDGIEKFAKNKIKDETFILLNRYKTKPSKFLGDELTKQTGLDLDVLKELMKKYNQNEQLREQSLGKNYRDDLRAKIKSFKVNEKTKIKDVERLIKEGKKLGEPILENLQVKGLIKEIQNAVKVKVGQMYNRENKVNFDVKFTKLFDVTEQYKKENIKMLQIILTNIDIDIDLYNVGDGGMVAFDGINKNLHSKKEIINYINDIKQKIKLALDTSDDNKQKNKIKTNKNSEKVVN